MFENSLINQIRNGGNIEAQDAEIVLPEDINFEVEGVQCTVGFQASAKKAGVYFVNLTAQINGATLSNRYKAKSTSEEELENAKQILTKSVIAINKILKYNVNVEQDEEGKIIAKFDWETYSAFKEECSFGDFLPEVPEVSENNETEDGEEASENNELSCIINLKNADELEAYADELEETWKEVVENFAKNELYLFTVGFDKKEEITYISGSNIQTDSIFIYFEGNITSDEYARKVADVKSIKKSKIPSYETEMLKKVIFA